MNKRPARRGYAASMDASVNEADFRALAERALAELPASLTRGIVNVVILVEDEADADTLAAMNAAGPGDLLGLYQGWPLPDRGASYQGHPPDVIRLFRRPILAWCAREGVDVAEGVRQVLMHEIGHYFGLSDAELAARCGL